MPWVYQQSTGRLTFNGAFVATGYAGHNSNGQLGRNNPALDNVPDIGPLPRGRYTIGSAFNNPPTGPLSMRLAPDPSNSMHGRSDFLIHGDDAQHDASRGCIIMAHEVRVQIAASPDRSLDVIA
jgi:hypothetical protein